jgi:hypothetical protein
MLIGKPNQPYFTGDNPQITYLRVALTKEAAYITGACHRPLLCFYKE